MATIEDPSDWRFARWEAPVADCAEQLKLLQKHLKARLKKMDPGSWKCVKLNGESDVHFHRIDVERASQCLTLVVHRFPVGWHAQCLVIGRGVNAWQGRQE